MIPWILRDSYYGGIVDADAINRPWWAIFTTASFYANVGRIFQDRSDEGYALTPDGMISFQQATFPVLIFDVVMIAGSPSP